jgi:GH15 family glucan-1,4-alpha-glucosidase
MRGDGDLEETWAATAEEIGADILEHGVDGRGVLRQHYATDALDASTLLAAEFGSLPGNDERLRITQAFSHLALIEAAARIILAERLEEFTR